MENSVQNAKNELNEWWEVMSIKADLGLDNVKVDIFEMLALLQCLNKLEMLRANEDLELEC